jgi:hypothetical protein
MAVGHALEHVPEIGVRLDRIQPRNAYQRADYGSAPAAAVGAGEQVVLLPERNRPDGTLHRVGVDLDPAVVEEAAERRQAAESSADGLGHPAALGNAAEVGFKPGLHHLDQGARGRCSHLPPGFGRLAADARLNGVELGDPAQSLAGDR